VFEAWVTALRVFIIASSTSRSRRSTAPAVPGLFTTTGFTNSTVSPSAEVVAWTMELVSSKRTEAIPSKAFPRCGCARVGSFVSARTLSRSASFRKKNRGKKSRFVSR